MTTNPKASKFRIRRSGPAPSGGGMGAGATTEGDSERPQAARAARPQAAARAVARSGQVDSPATVRAEDELNAIRAEGLTGRQLRLARRMAQRQGLAVTSDLDAVRQLRAAGIDPFQRGNILDFVGTGGEGTGEAPTQLPATTKQNLPGIAGGRVQLPQTMPAQQTQPALDRQRIAEERASEIHSIQRDLVKRRRRRSVLLLARLAAFVGLPTAVCGYYFFAIATPMYLTKSEFVIQKAESAAPSAAGLGGLFSGTSMANQQDSMTVQSYLSSRAAMVRLDGDHAFKAVFSDPSVDAIQRLAPDASNEQAFATYSRHVKISYDPTEGIVRLEVSAPDPHVSLDFSQALISYAEEQVDQLTQRLRADQMEGALQSYQQAEQRRTDALNELLRIQSDVEAIDPVGESAAALQQISQLEVQRQRKILELTTLQSAAQPNAGRVNAVQGEIDGFDSLIATLRSQMTQSSDGGSLAAKNTELRLAEENYQFQTIMVQQALQMMETSRIEANRQVRYLSLGVEPVAPDEAAFPRSTENTLLALLVFSGIYLMISLTVSILREQISA